MEKEKIIDSLETYLEEEKTDYAVMISGEWGIGKTHFLKNEIFKLFRKLGYRCIYVSLIGYNNEIRLENKIFQTFNPFYNPSTKSATEIEAEYLESFTVDPENTKAPLPSKTVLCFDDLERIDDNFFESAMGLMNTFIEHNQTKCIFLCYENILNEKVKRYREIKEKYIRYTYPFTPDFSDIIKSNNETKNSYSEEEISIILTMFRKGNSSNLRTLFYILSIFKLWNNNLVKIKNQSNLKTEIRKLALSYCCFYSIESRKGTPCELLDKITIAYNRRIPWKNIAELTPISKETTINEQSEDSKNIENIQQLYFSDNSIEFERFQSISDLIKNGYLNQEVLKTEIERLDTILNNKKQKDNESKLVDSINDINLPTDAELHERISDVIDAINRSTFSLTTYLKLYNNLVWIESIGIKGVDIDDKTTKIFEESVNRAFETGTLEYISNFKNQIGWYSDDKSIYAKKYHRFMEFLNNINEQISIKKKINTVNDLLTAIRDNNIEQLPSLLSTEAEPNLNELNAGVIYSALTTSSSKTINEFTNSLRNRYSKYENSLTQIPTNETDFITELHKLLKSDSRLNLEVKKTVKEVQLMLLKKELEVLLNNTFENQ